MLSSVRRITSLCHQPAASRAGDFVYNLVCLFLHVAHHACAREVGPALGPPPAHKGVVAVVRSRRHTSVPAEAIGVSELVAGDAAIRLSLRSTGGGP